MAVSRSIEVSEPVTGLEVEIEEEVEDAMVEVVIGHAIMSLFVYALSISTYYIVGTGISSQLQSALLLNSRSLKKFPI